MKLACEKHAIKEVKKRINALHMLIRIMPYERAKIPESEYHCYVKGCHGASHFIIKRIDDMLLNTNKDDLGSDGG